MHEQMSGYKRMRREHQGALFKLEERCKLDMDAHKSQLDREYEALLQTFSRDLERLHVRIDRSILILLMNDHQHILGQRNKSRTKPLRKSS
jgi:thousand and one amino acid protein kinase